MSKTMPRSKTVKIVVFKNGQEQIEEVEVRKAGLGKWKKIIDSLKKVENLLPQIIERKGYDDPDKFLDNLTTLDLAGLIPEIFSFALEEIIEVLAIGTSADKKFIEQNVGPDEAVELFTAIVEVNNLYKVAEAGKQVPFLGMMNSQMRKRSLTK